MPGREVYTEHLRGYSVRKVSLNRTANWLVKEVTRLWVIEDTNPELALSTAFASRRDFLSLP